MKKSSSWHWWLGLCLVLNPALRGQTYPTLTQIVNEMQAAASSFPAICQFVDLTSNYGTPPTHLGRSMHAVKISDNVAQEEDEPSFFIAATHHGNEIVNPVIALDAISRLTQGYGIDPTITALVDDNEIWIVPNCNPDGYALGTRHNARPGSTVDLNRNYPFLWSSPCNSGVKGPSPGSEPETQTIMAFSLDQHFAKVLDYHSSGRETLYAYQQNCPNHQLTSYLQAEATALSQNSGYGGSIRGPSANGEQYQWQLGLFSNYAFLTETHSSQQPPYASAVSEAATVWPGTVWMLQRPIPVWGHVTDATTGAPLEADISYVENPFTRGERNTSEHLFGRYHAFLPNGTHTLRFEHPCYFTQAIPVTVTSSGIQLDVALVPDPCFTLEFSTAGGGAGDLHLALSGIPASTVQGFTLLSFNTALAPGAGVVYGINPDLLTIDILASPLVPGSIFHWGAPSFPTLFPAAPFDLPTGALSALAGASVDGRAVALDSFWNGTATDLIRITF